MHVEISVLCSDASKEILIAEISDLNYDSVETEEGFLAYCNSASFNLEDLNILQQKYQSAHPFTFTYSNVKKINWNKEWEKNFQPVEIGDCRIRASFHAPDPNYELEVIIDPKMSFGTGHHETTSLMIATQLELDFDGKNVLDCGFGTGILSIVSALRGATKVVGVEIDEWCVVNAGENAILNGIESVEFMSGTIGLIDPVRNFDILLANINKNILLDEISAYSKRLKSKGVMLLSGFYLQDLEEIKRQCQSNGLVFVSSKEKNNWVAAQFQRTP